MTRSENKNLEEGANLPLSFDEVKCIGCNACLEVCQVDVMLPNPQAGAPPLVSFPGECWYCGSCVEACEYDAITLNELPKNRVNWIRKDSLC